MEPPPLKLVMLQGPREGETLEFRPGSTIRIGRLVRGNTLPIKDDGVSSKHFSIGSESGKWVIRDLDSFNGTILNDTTKLSPNTPFDLHDGDSIKIGEYTSILVKIDGHDESKVRRNPKRRVGEKGAELSTVGSGAENRGRRGRVLKESEKSSELEENNGGKLEELEKSEVVSVVGNRRRGRPRNARVLKKEDTDKLKIEENLGISRELENVGPVEAKAEPRISPRRTRSKKNEQILVSDLSSRKNLEGSSLGCGGVEIESKMTRGGTRRRNVREEPPKCVQIDEDEENIKKKSEGKMTRGGTRRRRNVQEEPPKCVRIDEDEENVDITEDKENLEGLNLGEENSREVVSGSNVRESCDKIENESACGVKEGGLGVEAGRLDLEKMTLGEWFEYLEVHLPKQIVDATEEMIEGMREKGKRVHEFVVQQKNEKFKQPMR